MDMDDILLKLQDKQFRRSLTNAVLALAQVSAGLGYAFDIDFLTWVMGAGLTAVIGAIQAYNSFTNVMSNRKQKKLMKEKTNAEKISDIVNK